MSTPPDNLVLELLRAIRATQDRHSEMFREIISRVSSLERGLASVEHRLADLASDRADQSERIDRLAERIARIERRLELADQ